MGSTISKSEYDNLQKARDSVNDSGATDYTEPDTDSATVAMLGGEYRIGNLSLPQFSLGTVALLSVAGVDLIGISGDDDDQPATDQFRDIAVSLYVISHGTDACNMLMGVQQRLKALSKLERLASKTPDMFDRYMAKIDEIGGGAFAELETLSYCFLDSLEGVTIEDIAVTIGQMAEDFATTMGLLPEEGDAIDGKKN